MVGRETRPRPSATKDPGARIAFFEFSADPDLADRDPYGDATLAYHPAIGYTQSLRRLRSLGDGLPIAEWRRAFLNLPTKGDEQAAFDVAMWTERAIPESDPAAQPRRPGDTVIAYDAARDGSAATIAAAWLDEDGDPVTAVAWTGNDVRELEPRLRHLWADGYRRIVADPTGPTRLVAETLAADGIGQTGAYSDYQDACQALIDRARDGTVSHVQSAAVLTAIDKTRIRAVNRGMDFDAARSAGPIDALRATALAVWAAGKYLSRPVLQIW